MKNKNQKRPVKQNKTPKDAKTQNKKRKQPGNKSEAITSKVPEHSGQIDDLDGIGDMKGLERPHEIFEANTLGWIETLRRKRVCLFPGPEPYPNDAGITDFFHCLPFLGDCNALIFCAPHYTKENAQAKIDDYTSRDNSALKFDCGPINASVLNSDLIGKDDLLFPTMQKNLLVWRPDLNAVPEATQPPHYRFWAYYVILKIEGWSEKIHLLHLGLRGDHAWPYFLQPNGIPVARLIANPFYP